ncbi:potassium channel family protein [Mobiluncus curtisii]|uniref:Ktr system potassium uptake protein A n=1 Tax=Mobiluncus curtisii TaxID=2051 RepID=A0A2X3BDG2_9ACTO|nr:TrkA family potassium uptake protein [Mobiluncus curtisii]SQC01672.1 Ktr system potassium uptake protein A [Mobiluncus curtisii]
MSIFNTNSVPEPPAHPTGNPQSAVVIGLGRFGLSMATELEASGVEVLGIDCNPEVVQRASALIRHVVRADATDKEALAQLAVDEYACGVVTIGGDLAASILSASALLTLHCPQVWAKASSVEQGEILNQMGITRVFYPESEMGLRAAHQVAQSFEDYIDLGHGFALVINQSGTALLRKDLG